MEISGVSESVEVMRLISEIFSQLFDKTIFVGEKGIKVLKVVGGCTFKQWEKSKAKAQERKLEQEKNISGEQDIEKMMEICNKSNRPMFMQLDRAYIDDFSRYAAKYNLTYAWLPDLNTTDDYIEIMYPSSDKILFDVYMDKNEAVAKPYTFSQYAENARDEDMLQMQADLGSGFTKFAEYFDGYQEDINEILKTGDIRISKEQLEKTDDGYSVTLIDESGQECFLLVAADRISTKDNEIVLHLDKEKRMLVKYPDRNEITVDKNTLLIDETASSYFTKVPRSKGQKYIFVNKADASEIYDGKTIKTKLNPDKEYEVCDSNGKVTDKIIGKDLYNKYYDKVATPIMDIIKMHNNYSELHKKAEKAHDTSEGMQGKTENKEAATQGVAKEVNIHEHKETDIFKENVIFEICPEQLQQAGNNAVKVHMPAGDLYVYPASVIRSEGHIFVSLPGNKQYKLFDAEGKKSDKTYAASDVIQQNIEYAMAHKSTEVKTDTVKENRGKINGEHDRSKRNSPNR